MQILEITTRRHRRFDIVALRGELDLAGAADLRARLRAACKANNDLLILDMTELEFTDSTGLAILVEYHSKTKTSGGGMVLTGVRPTVARVLGITGLDRELTITDRLDDAVAALERLDREPPEQPEEVEVRSPAP